MNGYGARSFIRYEFVVCDVGKLPTDGKTDERMRGARNPFFPYQLVGSDGKTPASQNQS